MLIKQAQQAGARIVTEPANWPWGYAGTFSEKVRGLLDRTPYLRASLALFAESVHGAGGDRQ